MKCVSFEDFGRFSDTNAAASASASPPFLGEPRWFKRGITALLAFRAFGFSGRAPPGNANSRGWSWIGPEVKLPNTLSIEWTGVCSFLMFFGARGNVSMVSPAGSYPLASHQYFQSLNVVRAST